MVRITIFLLLATVTVAVVVIELDGKATPVDAEVVALELVGDGRILETRRDGGRWEVDVVRPDGSMVQVNVGDDLELISLDEELGPAGTFAPDELRGRRRAGAVEAAFVETGPGQVVSVERDSNGEIDARVRTRPDGLVQVELDGRFRVLEVHREDLGDE